MRKIVVAIGGSSGSIYARRLLDHLQGRNDVIVGVVMSTNAVVNWEIEVGPWDASIYSKLTFYNKQDYNAPFASGSAKYDTMIICPASMGLVGRIASGVSMDLTTRAADVILKERRRLIVVPREAPYNLIHLRNMTTITEAGGIICPATPSFYSQPTSLNEIADTVVHRVIDLAQLPMDSYRWGE